MPRLLTIRTPDSLRNSRPSRHLKTSHWPLAVHTGHVRYDQDSELSKLVKRETSELPTIAGTPNLWNSRLTLELMMNQPEINNITIAGQIPDMSGRLAKNMLALLSLKHSKLTWVGLSTYETLSINMIHPS